MAVYANLLAAKELPEFHYDLLQTACSWLNLFARHNFSKPRRDFVDALYNITL
jgi:hypothetical protein